MKRLLFLIIGFSFLISCSEDIESTTAKPDGLPYKRGTKLSYTTTETMFSSSSSKQQKENVFVEKVSVEMVFDEKMENYQIHKRRINSTNDAILHENSHSNWSEVVETAQNTTM